MTHEEVFRYIVKECHMSIEEYGDLNDYQIKVLCTRERKEGEPPIP